MNDVKQEKFGDFVDALAYAVKSCLRPNEIGDDQKRKITPISNYEPQLPFYDENLDAIQRLLHPVQLAYGVSADEVTDTLNYLGNGV